MQAIVVRQHGAPEVLQLETLPDPVAGSGEIRVRVAAIGVNPYDTYMRAGGYANAPDCPYIPGADAAGVIDQIGPGVTGLSVGERVYVGGTAAGKSHGAYASLVVCRPTQVHALPAHLTFAQGAAIHVPYATAWRALFGRAQLKAGESVFVHGGSGAVGLATIQIARAAGHTVVATASTPEGTALAQQAGAAHVFNHRTPGYLDQVAAALPGGPSVIVEMLANVNLDHDLTLLARHGRIVVVGNRGRIEIDPRKIMGKEAGVYGMALWNLSEDELAGIHGQLAAGLAGCALSPVVNVELPLAEAPRAHALIMEPGARGKIVLVP
jgi:NADPH2:quinone reductase